jgi:peptide/nickel transport system substrate-binding protein
MGIIPKHILENQDINTASFNRHPIGTGPFKFKEWLSDQKITVVANKDYFRGPPHLDQITMRIIPESSLREMEFMVESIDYYGVEAHQYGRFIVDADFRVYMTPANGYTYIGWNMKVPLFQDKRVRRALTYAINRREIVDYLLYGLGRIATGPYPHHMWYYNHDVKPLEYDPEKAKELLKEAGWEDADGDGFLDKDGKRFRFTLITNNGNTLRKNATELVQRQLKEIGIEVEIALYEWSVFISNKINPRDYEACVLGWSLSLDPDIYELWHSSQAEKGFNFVFYSNPEVDRLIEAGRSEYDREKRKEIYHKIHSLIAEDQPYTFLFVPESTPALHKGAFKIRTADASGKAVLEDIKMTKYGLTYFLEKWVRVKAHSLQP